MSNPPQPLDPQISAELSELQKAIGSLYKNFDASKIEQSNQLSEIKGALEEWIKTNRLLIESDHTLLQALLANSKEVLQSRDTSNRGMDLLQQFSNQLRILDGQIAKLTTSLTNLPPAALGEQGEVVQALLRQLSQTQAQMLQTQQTQQERFLHGLRSALKAGNIPIKEVGNKTWIGKIWAGFVGSSLGLGTSMGLGGLILGASLHQAMAGPVSGVPQKLTVNDVIALRWAKSSDGQMARRIFEWNVEKLERLDCLQDVERLGVTLKVSGRPASSGFCTLWVVPPDQRQFK